MPETPQIAPAHSNPAVARCCAPWDQVYQQARAQGKGDLFSGMDAAQAFRLNLPALDNSDVIRDFIACVAQASYSAPSPVRTALVSSTPLRSPTPASAARTASNPPPENTPPGGAIHSLFALVNKCAKAHHRFRYQGPDSLTS